MSKQNINYLQTIARALPTFDRPIFIVSSPRAGSSLLYETLALSNDLWTIRGENHQIIENIAALNLAQREYKSNILDATDASLNIEIAIKANLFKNLKNKQNIPLDNNISSIRMLEKTPKNALRIPFINAIFPDALFIYLYRDPQENISSILEGWKSRRCISYPTLPGWNGYPWSFLLIPGWEDLTEKPLIEIAASQWQIANETIMDNLISLPTNRWSAIHYRDLIKNSQTQITRLCNFAQIEWQENLKPGKLALSSSTITPPDVNKWHKNQDAIASILPQMKSTTIRFKKLTVSNNAR